MAIEWVTTLSGFLKLVPEKWKDKFQEWLLAKGKVQMEQKIADGKADEVFREFLSDQNIEPDVESYLDRLNALEPKTDNIRKIHSRIRSVKKKATKKAARKISGGRSYAKRKAKASKKIRKKSSRKSIRKNKSSRMKRRR